MLKKVFLEEERNRKLNIHKEVKITENAQNGKNIFPPLLSISLEYDFSLPNQKQ